VASTAERLLLKVSPNGPVFDLPIYVARDEGLFARAGLGVQFEAKYSERNSSRDAFARLKESLFEQGKADAYNLCEWAGIDRSERSCRGAQILALRPAVAAQAIVTFDASIQEPRDLECVPVGINERTGSHYTTLQMLGGTLRRDQIALGHIGHPEKRYEALRAETIRAVCVMEPFISLALKEGAHIVASCFYRGAEVISPSLAAEQRTAYLESINAAADLLTKDFDRYKHYITEHVEDRLAPSELSNHFIRYTHYRIYEEKRFSAVYEWMSEWGLAQGTADHATVVAAPLP